MDSPHLPGDGLAVLQHDVGAKGHDPAELVGVDPVTYGLRRPDPAPADLGYHEVFNLLVIAGVAAHFVAIGVYALRTS